MFQDVFVIGATGKVGFELIKQIISYDGECSHKHVNPTRVVGVASSKSYLYEKNGLTKEQLLGFSKKEIIGSNYSNVLDLISIVDQEVENVFIDVTAEKEEMLNFHLKIIKETKFKLVTANKNPLILCDTDLFHTLVKDSSRYGYRCSVMAGAEAVNKMVDLNDLGDNPKSIIGCFSGTLGYLSTELENGNSLSSTVKTAVDLGLTEPDPVLDLNGEDVAKKMLILVRSAGFEMNYSDINLSPFVENNLLTSKSVEDLLNNLKDADEKFKELILTAQKQNKCLRFIGEFNSDTNNIDVGLKEIDKASPLGQLKGKSNKIVVITNTYPKENPYVVESPGAGLTVTAQNIRRDLLTLLNSRQISYCGKVNS